MLISGGPLLPQEGGALPMNRSPVMLVALALCFFSVSRAQIQFVFDPKPDAGIPIEALHAGTVPDSQSKAGKSGGNVEFRIVQDDKDYGPLRQVMNDEIHWVKVRYYDPSLFKTEGDAQEYLTALLHSSKGSTHPHIFWAEGLGVPVLETTIRHARGRPGKLLVWPYRAVYQDGNGKWWFTAWMPDQAPAPPKADAPKSN